MKRLLDIVFSFLVLILFLPIGLPIALVLRFTGEGEVLYRQPRVGRGRRMFGLIKLVTMLKDSPNLGTGSVTVKDDPRVLPFGRLLRKTKLNEFPQFLNVLAGDMSLVGPRPLAPQTFEYYPPDIQEEIATVVPGLTGVGSIVFRDEESVIARSGKDPLACYREEIAPYKGELERWYIRNRGLWLDMKLIGLTVLAVLMPRSRLCLRLLPDLPKPANPALFQG